MIGADIVVAYFDKDQKAFKAVDYFMSKYAQVSAKFLIFPLDPKHFFCSVMATRECVLTRESVAKTTRTSCSARIATV
jgi:hypothetical protein